MADIFISYAREDRETAQQLAQTLASFGWSVWWDRHIPVGRRFEDVIGEELAAARCVIVLWSAHAVESTWVKDEAAYGRKKGVLKPVLLEDVTLPFTFDNLQTVDLRGWTYNPEHLGFRDLIRDLADEIPIVQPQSKQPLSLPPGRRGKTWKWASGYIWIAAAAAAALLVVVLVDITGFEKIREPTPDPPTHPGPAPPEERQMAKGKLPPIDAPKSSGAASIHEPPQPKPEPNHDSPFQPVNTFKECDVCPEMVVVPAGEFQMGAKIGPSIEKPQRQVVVPRPLAIGRYEVTRTEWNHYVNEGGCARPVDAEALSGDHPITRISWHDAERYVNWLADKTGQRYRLLSEAEWEYAARAGATTSYSLGGMITPAQATFGTHDQPSKVGAHAPNAFGLFDVHGNVWEWVEDCPSKYAHLGPASEASTSGECALRGLRGGAYDSSVHALRVSNRYFRSADTRAANIGFRIARELDDGEEVARD